ncbi:hypothetical protein P43SY_000604 [Pythium insidiosum]|uniref:Myotubularin phosphatase domain-containing protein n=1 Tax=Pythium insidiosum TaxID=114742 RepID=A0AAD5MC83_PYTIN|nr:hypothetical protein P43SY_000604 [Pythium insidiosum]
MEAGRDRRVAPALSAAIAAVEAAPAPETSRVAGSGHTAAPKADGTCVAWDESLTLRLVLIWRSVQQEHGDVDETARLAIVLEQLQATANGVALSHAAVESQLRAVMHMHQFIARVNASVSDNRRGGIPGWFELSSDEKRALRVMHGVRGPDISLPVFVILDSVLNPTAAANSSPVAMPRADAKSESIVHAGESVRDRPFVGDLDHAEIVDFKRNWSEEVTMRLAKTWHRVAIETPEMRGAMLSQKVHSEFVAAIGGCSRSRKAIEDKMHAMKDMYRFIRMHDEGFARGAKRQPWFELSKTERRQFRAAHGIRVPNLSPDVYKELDQFLSMKPCNSSAPAVSTPPQRLKRARQDVSAAASSDFSNVALTTEELLLRLLQAQEEATQERRRQHLEQMALLREPASADASRAASMMDDTTPFNRFYGEKDVLAAITCEYLDEAASKKDTSAATVCLGRVMMTTYRFQFRPDPHEYERVRRHLLYRSEDEIADFFLLPLGCIAGVKKKNSVIEIVTKDLRQQSFRFDVVEVTRIFSVLTTYVFPNKIDFLFAFYHRLPSSLTDENEVLPCERDWDVYDPRAEWDREGVLDNGKWRVSLMNEGFREIDTYPELLVVPACIPDGILCEATAFRSLGRIPCLCWFNKSNGATLSRSSQPKVGMSKATSPADEKLVAAISASSLLSDALHIIDCRPMSNALANRAKGYGVESTDNYKNCTVSFMNIPNIHSMRDSMKKLRSLCLSLSCDNLQWLGSVEDTKWLLYVRQLLKSALHVAQLLRDGQSVLLHCSHGWDRTSQIASLSQLILDPYFRTWKGFQVLIEKEWLSFGHPFQLRLSHGEKADTQESPIFIQFLDCVWQLLRLYPTHFEFNEGFLLMLAEALHSCRFGTFLFDCRKHREEVGLKSRTPSVWAWINGFRQELTEPMFVPNQHLSPPAAGLLRSVVLWDSMFMRWSVQPSLHEPSAPQDFFADQKSRVLTWQLPRPTWDVLNEAMAVKLRHAEAMALRYLNGCMLA